MTSQLRPNIVLAVAAHPDDIDFGAGGTVAAFAQQGAKVYYVVLTDGGKGSHDPQMSSERLCDVRKGEQRAACKILGATDAFFCSYPDGLLENTIDVKRDVVRAIRYLKPDVLITMDPSVLYVAERGIINHPDHRAAGQAALDAAYPLARDALAFPELIEQEALEPHAVQTVLLITLTNSGNYSVDISNTLPQKLAALAEHKSQFTGKKIEVTATNWAREAGSKHGCNYAEVFTRIDIS